MLKRSFCKCFTLSEVLIAILVIGIILALIIFSLKSHKRDVDFITYNKVYDDLSVATKAVSLHAYGNINALTNDPSNLRSSISQGISTSGTFDGCKYDNLRQLIGANCNDQNVKGTTLSSGTDISFIGQDRDNNNLVIPLINDFNKIIDPNRNFVGVVVVNNNNKKLDGESIFPIYENGLGAPHKNNSIIANNPGDNTGEIGGYPVGQNLPGVSPVSIPPQTPSASCEGYGYIWIDNKCYDPYPFILKYRIIYRELDKAITAYRAINGNAHLGGNSAAPMENMLEQYLQVPIKKKSKSSLWASGSPYNGAYAKKLNGKNQGISRQGAIYFNEGVMGGINFEEAPMVSIGAGHAHWAAKPPCGTNFVGDYNASLHIDVNGEEHGPNIVGLDIYYVLALHSGLYPWPLPDDYTCGFYLPVGDFQGDAAARAPQHQGCKVNESSGFGCSKWFLTNNFYQR